MTVIVAACSAFGITISEAKTEIMCLQTKDGGEVLFAFNAAGQVYKETIEFVYLVGFQRTQRLQHRDHAASSESLRVIQAVQDGNP